MTNPFENLTSEAAIKSAYRKLSLKCHPDTRPDKERATEEFRELTRIYKLALNGIIEPAKKPQPKPHDWWHRDPDPPPPPPNGHIYRETVDLGDVDNFEFEHWGEATRTFICSRAILLYGGKLRVKAKISGKGIFGSKWGSKTTEQTWEADIPPNQQNVVKVRIQLPVGPVILTLVGRR